MPVITPSGWSPSGLTQSNLTREDYAKAIDRIEPAQTKMTSLAGSEVKLSALERHWNVDTFPDVKGARGRAAAQGVTTGDATDYTSGVRKMGNYAQGISETWSLSWQSDIPELVGKEDLKSEMEFDAMVLLKQQIERAIASTDQIGVPDAGVGLGAITSSYRALCHSSRAYAAPSGFVPGKPTDLHSSPSAIIANATGSLAANHTRAMWRTISLILRTAVKKDTDWMAICGIYHRQAICDLTDPATTTTTAATTGTGAVVGIAAQQVRVTLARESDSAIGAVVDEIRTGNGRFLVAQTDHIGQTTASGTGVALTTGFAANTTGTWGGHTGLRAASVNIDNPYAAHILEKGNLWKCWGKVPYSVQLGQDGSGDTFDLKGMFALGVKNPIRGCTLMFTS